MVIIGLPALQRWRFRLGVKASVLRLSFPACILRRSLYIDRIRPSKCPSRFTTESRCWITKTRIALLRSCKEKLRVFPLLLISSCDRIPTSFHQQMRPIVPNSTRTSCLVKHGPRFFDARRLRAYSHPIRILLSSIFLHF